MEVPGMGEIAKPEAHLTSAVAFVEGGIQEACDDACSICLEDFSDSDPSTVTGCKHEFHLQCILEWCQRSSQCPMCWQSISLKDPTSQELLEGVERERSVRLNPAWNSTIFHHPTLGDFELQHLPMGATDAELEERIIQHLAAAAAMGRARHIARREGQRNRASAQTRPQFLLLSNHSDAQSAISSPPQSGEGEQVSATTGQESLGLVNSSPSSHFESASASTSGSNAAADSQGSPSNNSRSPTQSSPNSPGSSDFQSFSESMKSRFNAVSTRYKESISKSTRGWKERLFSRNTSMADLGSEVKREVNAGIATVSRMMERLETKDNRPGDASVSNSADNAVQTSDSGGDNSLSSSNVKASPSCAAGSSSS